jgi:putative ABC transport system substrate-binding protein
VQTGQLVVKILKGAKPGSLAWETSSKLELYVNPGAASRQGVTLSDALIKSATKVVK